MRLLRRRTTTVEPARRPGTDLVLRTERAVVALAVHAQQLHDRLERLERRVDEWGQPALDAPTHADVLEVRLHSARVAAELSRVTVELRSEIDDLATEWAALPDASPGARRAQALAETIIDLSDSLDTRPGDLASSDGDTAEAPNPTGFAATA